MNVLMQEINSYIISAVMEKNLLVSTIKYPADFSGFDGHFPNNPILPGICKIQTVVAMYENKYGAGVGHVNSKIKRIKQAKYFMPVTCDEELTFKIDAVLDKNNDTLLKALITRGKDKIAKIEVVI